MHPPETNIRTQTITHAETVFITVWHCLRQTTTGLTTVSVLNLGIMLLSPFNHSKDKSVYKFKCESLGQQFGKLTFGNSFN